MDVLLNGAGLISGRLRSTGGRPGEVINLWKEDSPTRVALRELTSDAALGVDCTVYFGLNRDAEQWYSKNPHFGRRGRWNALIPRCSVPGCTMLALPDEAFAFNEKARKGTCGCHSPVRQ